MYQIIYISQTQERLPEAELSRILERARTNNTQQNVTGILLYAGRTFFQVLEGPRQTVEGIYDKIYMDDRHARVKMLSGREIDVREFSDWSMGFRQLDDGEIADTAFFSLTKGSLPDMIPDSISEETIKFLRGFADVKIAAA